MQWNPETKHSGQAWEDTTAFFWSTRRGQVETESSRTSLVESILRCFFLILERKEGPFSSAFMCIFDFGFGTFYHVNSDPKPNFCIPVHSLHVLASDFPASSSSRATAAAPVTQASTTCVPVLFCVDPVGSLQTRPVSPMPKLAPWALALPLLAWPSHVATVAPEAPASGRAFCLGPTFWGIPAPAHRSVEYSTLG